MTARQIAFLACVVASAASCNSDGLGLSAGDGGRRDSPDLAAPLRTCEGFQSTPSRQLVHFGIHNDSGVDRFIPESGAHCDTYAIASESLGMVTIPLSISWTALCVCECFPPSVGTTGIHRIRPGETFAVTWDARRLITCTEDVDCSKNGWPGVGIAHHPIPAAAPVEPGEYEFAIRVASSPPSWSGGPDDYYSSGSGFFGNPSVGDAAPVCADEMGGPAPTIVKALFTIPPTGDVNVAVELR